MSLVTKTLTRLQQLEEALYRLDREGIYRTRGEIPIKVPAGLLSGLMHFRFLGRNSDTVNLVSSDHRFEYTLKENGSLKELRFRTYCGNTCFLLEEEKPNV